jgi:toxin ParE1/3/4
MRCRVSQRRQARQDILELVTYIAADNPKAAADLYDAYERVIATTLAEMPDIGRPYRSAEAGLEEVRAVAVGRFRSYLVFYRRRDDEVDVLRVLHSSRDLRSLLSAEEP